MRGGPLWRISVTSTPEAEDAVGILLEEIFETTATTNFDALNGRTTVSVFLPQLPPATAARLDNLRARLRGLPDCGLDAGQARVSIRRLPPENWAESWKRHFKPVEIGKALLLKPSWSKRRPRMSQAVVVLDPGLSFGTGQHATTAFCLHELVARRKPGMAQSFLDVGTGSGILAIAAVKLGYTPVRAIDFDPEAVRVARANARRNGVSQDLRIECRNVTTLPPRPGRRYDLVCANLLSTLLIAQRRRISALVSYDGVLVLAGILRAEFGQVQDAYESLRMRLMASRCEKEWRSGSFAFGRW